MDRQHTRFHRALAALGAPRRYELLVLVLSGRDRSVSQLARAVRLSQSCTTRHLQALERAGLVKGWRDGKRVVFRPEPRDAEASALLASLSGPEGLASSAPGQGASPRRSRGKVAISQLAPGAGAFTRLEARAMAVASTAELEPPAAEEIVEPAAPTRVPRPRRRRTQGGGPARAVEESGISPEAPQPPRYWSEIEDYLL
jgi:DNA-binding transcriptional ArsR family regulator